KTDGEAMINSIQTGDHLLPVVSQVSLAETASNAIPTLKDPNNKTAKDLWDALERQMCGFEYGEQDRKAAILYEYETFKATEGEQFLDTYLRYLQVINDKKKCGYKKDNYVNDALGYKKKAVVITSNPLALVAEKAKVSKQKEKVEVQTESEGSDDEDISDLKKITSLLAKTFESKEKAKVKDYNYYKTKMLLAKKDNDAQVLLAEDRAWMESSGDSDQEINANMVFMAKMEKVLSDLDEKYYDNLTNYGLFVNDNDDQEIFHDAIESTSKNFIENHIDSQKDYNKSEVDHNDSEEKDHLADKLIQKFNHKIAKCQKQNTFEEKNNELNEQMKVLNEKNADLLAQPKVLQDQLKASRKILEKETNISELEGCVSNKDLEIEKCLERLNDCENKLHKIGQTKQTIHMIMPLKDNLYNGRKGMGFENPSYFEKAKDLRPSLYDEKVTGLGYTLMFLTHSDEALEIEKFKRARENKIKFLYDYGNLNASYVNEKINFSDDYFQEIINPYFEKIDSPFQTSSLKP
nr:hypothetical protein [Tanacetum cinerariifolium]